MVTLAVLTVLKLHSLFENFKKHHSIAHESRNALAFLRLPKVLHKIIIPSKSE